jgi:phosphatidylserine/phosphatidylglycerophosphate/cardiolipin synthase-like enzyme
MRKAFALSVALIFILLLPAPATHAKSLTLNNAPTQVYFNPNGGCTDAMVKEISNAKSEILVQAYSFNSTPIAKALVDAHKRGVKVAAILDKSQKSEKYTSAAFLANSRIPTFIDARHAIAHTR